MGHTFNGSGLAWPTAKIEPIGSTHPTPSPNVDPYRCTGHTSPVWAADRRRIEQRGRAVDHRATETRLGTYRCTGHTSPAEPLGPPLLRITCPSRCTGHTFDRLSGKSVHHDVPDIPRLATLGVLSITMYRTYLSPPTAPSGQSTLAIVETYEACVHHDVPDIFRACTHDEPDILLPMNRTYLGRALTMYRTYHYR